MTMDIRFWGVRGSMCNASASHMVYGGNTACVQVNCGQRVIILDAGTGICQLGKHALQNDTKEFDLLLSHTHWDHIIGFPMFAQAYKEQHIIRIMAGHLGSERKIKEIFSYEMNHPMFPVPLENLRADIVFNDFVAGSSFDLGDGIRVATAPLNHPDGATGYRIEYEGNSLCYVTDTEHLIEKPDQSILSLIEGADIVIYDSTYTDEEFPSKLHWGHSTWQEGVRLCRAAHVKQLVLFHHEFDRDDDAMEKIEKQARNAWPQCIVARERMEISLGASSTIG